MHDPEILHGLRNFVWSAAMYGNAAARVASRGHSLPRIHNEGRHIFVVGAPRSGTTFLAGAIAAQPGLVDLGEVQPVKAAIPKLTSLPEPEAASRFRRTLDRVRRLGLSAHLRGVEQTPETAFVLRAVLQAYPEAQTVHIVRDGREACAGTRSRCGRTRECPVACPRPVRRPLAPGPERRAARRGGAGSRRAPARARLLRRRLRRV